MGKIEQNVRVYRRNWKRSNRTQHKRTATACEGRGSLRDNSRTSSSCPPSASPGPRPLPPRPWRYFKRGTLFRLYVLVGTAVGLFLPLSYLLGGFTWEVDDPTSVPFCRRSRFLRRTSLPGVAYSRRRWGWGCLTISYASGNVVLTQFTLNFLPNALGCGRVFVPT